MLWVTNTNTSVFFFVHVYLCDSFNLVQEDDILRVGDLLRFVYLCNSFNLIKEDDILRV